MNGWLMLSAFPLTTSPTAPLAAGRTRPGPLPHEHRVGRAARHPPPVGDGHAGGEFALRPGHHGDVTTVEEARLQEAGDHARIVQGGVVTPVFPVSKRSEKSRSGGGRRPGRWACLGLASPPRGTAQDKALRDQSHCGVSLVIPTAAARARSGSSDIGVYSPRRHNSPRSS